MGEEEILKRLDELKAALTPENLARYTKEEIEEISAMIEKLEKMVEEA